MITVINAFAMGSVTPFGALVYKSTGQSIGTTPTALDWENEVYDVGDWHSTSSDISRLTVPSGVTVCRVTSGLLSGSSNSPLIEHRKGGSAVRGMGKGDTENAGNHLINICSAIQEVSATNYFETFFSVSLGTSSPTSDNDTWFAIEAIDPTLKRALVYNSTSQSLSGGVTTTLTWDSETYDTDSFHSTSSNTSRLTVPSGVTLVRILGNIGTGSVSGQAVLSFLKGGASVRGLATKDVDTANADFVNCVSAPLEVSATEYFEMRAFCTIATSITATEESWFAIEEVPSTYKRALVYKTGTQSITSSASAVSWDAEVYDTDSIHDNVTNNTRLTVPSGCTRARLSFSIVGPSASGQWGAYVFKGGSGYRGMPSFDTDTAGADSGSAIGAWVDVTPGDYFELMAFSTTTRNIGTDDGTWFCLECQ